MQLRQERQLRLPAAVRVMRQRMVRVAGIAAAVFVDHGVRMRCAMAKRGILPRRIRMRGQLMHLAPRRQHRLRDQTQQKQQQRAAAQDGILTVADAVGHDSVG